MTEVVAFAYRVPRFTIELPFEFVCEDVAIHGRTCNLSETGALVQLQAPVQVDDIGRAHFRLGSLAFSLQARVTHAEFPEIGLSFVLASQPERQLVRLLARLAARNHREF